MDDGALIDFFVSSGFGGRTQKPFVQIVIKAADYMVQMSPAEARDLAVNLLHCADAAESDGFLVSFLRQRIGAKDSQVVQVLEDFRKWREEQANYDTDHA